jgi:hypothetical protein
MMVVLVAVLVGTSGFATGLDVRAGKNSRNKLAAHWTWRPSPSSGFSFTAYKKQRSRQQQPRTGHGGHHT